jgi:acetyl-CoA carboxylase biotin carboxyl carrier protein
MNLDEVEKLIQLMQRYELTELEVKHGDLEFAARKLEKAPQMVVHAPPSMFPSATSAPAMPSIPAAPEKNLKEITSPIVGTFYRSPAPDQAPYKEIGDRVSAEDVVCIVEAMKVMNEIKSGVNGTIRKILVDNSSPVEYGQPLFQVEVG